MQLMNKQISQLNTQLDEAAKYLETIRDFIRFGVTIMREYDLFIGQGTNDYFAESSAIVMQTLSLDWSADPEILDARLIPHEKQLILAILNERISDRKPLSYIMNISYFCELAFYVDERVLIPRSPIAELIKQQFYPYFKTDENAKPLKNGEYFEHGLPSKGAEQPYQILDLCTGSACIAVALATYFEHSVVDATDIDADALEVATINVEHNGLDDRINIIKSNLFDKIHTEQQYDLIVTNPPYVDAEDMANLPPEFEFEPELALAAGQDGLNLVHKILYEASDYLTQDGILIVEVGNSSWALKQSYPKIEFNWLEFMAGGTGIFSISRRELLANRDSFKAYCDTIPLDTQDTQDGESDLSNLFPDMNTSIDKQ